MTSFHGKTVLVTGAASGIGRLMAIGAARRGATVVVWDLDRESLDLVVTEITDEDGTAYAYTCDVGDRDAVVETARLVQQQVGPVDVLVNNAGVANGKRFLDLNADDVERTFRVNVLAHYWTVSAFLPGMEERGAGHLVTIASAAGLAPAPRMTAYATTKAAAVELTECLRIELAETAPGVRTTVVCPWYIDTGMFAGVAPVRFRRLTRLLKEEDVAESVLTAVERDRERLYLPWLVWPAAMLRGLPAGIADRILATLGVFRTMDHFVGRRRAPLPDVPEQRDERRAPPPSRAGRP